MDTQNANRQLRYLEEVRIPLHRAGFGTLPAEAISLRKRIQMPPVKMRNM